MTQQSDIEFLFTLAIEHYSKEHNCAYSDATELFHNNHVMEKMLVQHEYLHQIALQEVFSYVETLISAPPVQLYLLGTINADEAINRLRYNKVNNQISFHTEKALKHITLIKRSVYE